MPAARNRGSGLLMLVLFDLNGTITDLSGIGEPWSQPELGFRVLDRAVQMGLVDTVLGEYHDFSEHVAAALRYEVAARGLDPAQVDAALERAQRLDPVPDAADALDALREGGFPLAVLTNSGAASGRQTLAAAGLHDRFDAILGVDAVEKFKPHPDVYEHALQTLDVTAAEVIYVASHAWDITGAKHSGMRGAWVNYDGAAFPATGMAPDLTGRSLLEIATSLRAADPPAR